LSAPKTGDLNVQSSEVQRLAHFEEWYWWHRARQAIVSRLLRRFAPPAGGMMLDVGCGSGATSLALREFGRIVGVELGAEGARAARSRGLEVTQMDAGRLGVADGSCSTVVALDVLEHLDDDGAAALELRRVLQPDGVLLVTVPAYRWLWSSHDVALGHRRRYRRTDMERLLRSAGFEIELCSYVMLLALPPAALLRLLERLPGRQPTATQAESGYVPIPRWLNSLLSLVVGWDGLLAGHIPMPFGLSVFAIARPRAFTKS
jgi:SAM-dependent methyltransferase